MPHAIIIGGGVIGLLTARLLHQSGHRVTLLEQANIGQASSWAGGGIVSPLYPWRYDDAVTELARYSQAHYPAFCDTLGEETGIDPELTHNGLLIANVGNETEAARAWLARYAAHAEWVDRDSMLELNPGLGECIHDGLWFPDLGQVRNPRLVKSLKAANQQAGLSLLEQHRVKGLIERQGRVLGVRSDHGDIEGDFVVLCSGAWSGQLIDLPVKPIQGQMLLYQCEPDWLKRIILHDNRYIIPRRDGHVLFGSTMEDVGFEQATSAKVREELTTVARDLLPDIERFPIVKHWAGLRPATQNGIPFIGEHDELPGLFLNTGHFRNGIVLGLASAQLCADLINGVTPAINPSAYAHSARH